MTSILVTGASGFIGRHLVPQLRGAGHVVVAADRAHGDVADESTWTAFPAAQTVIHLAGESFVPDSWTRPETFLRSNFLGTTVALGYCRKHQAHLISLSSYMYGDPERLPIPENAPLVAKNPYALSKKLAEDASRFYAEAFGVDVTLLRLFNVYGPGQGGKFLIPYILQQVKGGVSIRVKDLEPKRDYVYVLDVVQAILRAVAEKRRFGVFNIGSGVSYSVAEVIQAIQSVWQTALPVHCDAERRAEEIMDTVADISAAQRELGWRPRFTLHKGMHDLFDKERSGE